MPEEFEQPTDLVEQFPEIDAFEAQRQLDESARIAEIRGKAQVLALAAARLAVAEAGSEEMNEYETLFEDTMGQLGLRHLLRRDATLPLPEDRDNFMQGLAVERKRLGIKQKQIAKYLGMSTAMISRMERGERSLNAVQFAALRNLVDSGGFAEMSPIPKSRRSSETDRA